jgi:TonB family protein
VVEVSLEIHSDGTVGEVRVIREPGFPLLKDAALAAAQKLRSFRFAPAQEHGRAVESSVLIPYRFVLKPEKEKAPRRTY